MGYDRKGPVRIGVRISVTRKMLGCHQNSLALHPLHHGYHLGGHIVPILSIGPGTNDRICRIVIDIRNRSQVHMYSQSSELFAHFCSQTVNLVPVRNGTQDHGGRIAYGILQAHAKPVLPVDGHQERDVGCFLIQVSKPCLLQGLTLKKKNASYLLPLHLPQYFLLM